MVQKGKLCNWLNSSFLVFGLLKLTLFFNYKVMLPLCCLRVNCIQIQTFFGNFLEDLSPFCWVTATPTLKSSGHVCPGRVATA